MLVGRRETGRLRRDRFFLFCGAGGVWRLRRYILPCGWMGGATPIALLGLLVGLTTMASSATTGGGGSVVSDGWGIKKAIRGGWLFMGREWDQRITLMVAAPVVMMAGPERAEASMAVPVARRRRVPWRV